MAECRLSRTHAVGACIMNNACVHRMVCRAGACRWAAAHWENGPPTSGGPYIRLIRSASDQLVVNAARCFGRAFYADNAPLAPTVPGEATPSSRSRWMDTARASRLQEASELVRHAAGHRPGSFSAFAGSRSRCSIASIRFLFSPVSPARTSPAPPR